MYLIFDTETNGLPKRFDTSFLDTDNWPRCIQLAWKLYNRNGKLKKQCSFFITPDGFEIDNDVSIFTGITDEIIFKEGIKLRTVLEFFAEDLVSAKCLVTRFPILNLNVLACELFRCSIYNEILNMPYIDLSSEETAKICAIPGGRGGKYKLPSLKELNKFLFGEKPEATSLNEDVEIIAECFFELKRLKRVFKDFDLKGEKFERND
ncbi:MAG: hypothetical protein H6584_06335 [Flavobacteriales bacterium]|nr:hypothetical protein [Flavobacteriales bacterium]